MLSGCLKIKISGYSQFNQRKYEPDPSYVNNIS